MNITMQFMKINGQCVMDTYFLSPRQNNIKFITLALEATVEYGDNLRNEGKIDAYHFGMNMGEAAGQTVMWASYSFYP